MRRLTSSTLVAALIATGIGLASPARAHEGGKHARGVVTAIAADHLVLKTAQGQAVTFAVTPATRFVRSSDVVPASAVRAGERAVVHAADAQGHLVATEVKLGAAPSK